MPPTLNDYEYQYRDGGGVKLNTTSTLPFWDVENVVGVSDFPEVGAIIDDLDGTHGSVIYAKFLTHRVIEITGKLYADTSAVESQIEALRATLIPDDIEYPFYFKHPTVVQKQYLCKPFRFVCDVAQGRRVGVAPFQIILLAADPRQYSDETSTALTSGVGTNLTNAGNVFTDPVWTCSVSSGAAVTVRVENTTTGRWVQFAFTAGATGTVTVDTRKKLCMLGSNVQPATFTQNNGWPVMQPGVNNMRITLTNATTGVVKWRSGWL